MPGSRGLTAIRWPCAAGGVALFLVTSPACRAHRTAPLGAIPVPSSFTRPCQPNHPPTQPIATAKLPMATIATGQPHGVYRCHAIPSTPPEEREKVPVLLQQARLTSKCHRWQAVRPAQRRVRLSEAAPIGPIIGHSDRAASEQKLSSHHTTSSQPLASIDATLHETPAIQKNYRRHAHARGTSRHNRP